MELTIGISCGMKDEKTELNFLNLIYPQEGFHKPEESINFFKKLKIETDNTLFPIHTISIRHQFTNLKTIEDWIINHIKKILINYRKIESKRTMRFLQINLFFYERINNNNDALLLLNIIKKRLNNEYLYGSSSDRSFRTPRIDLVKNPFFAFYFIDVNEL